MSTILTQANIDQLTQLFNSGDRGGFYWEYYKITGEYQALIQGQITTYSGTWGGLAMSGNYLAKITDQENYNLTLDEFSADIIAGTLNSILSDLANPLSGADGILTALQMQESDFGTWASKGMGLLFPGNIQFATSPEKWSEYRDIILSSGAENAWALGWMGLNLYPDRGYTPEQLGNRFDDYQGTQYEKIDLQGHPESDGRYLRVIDKQTGNLVFIQDTSPPFPFNALSWGEDDYRFSMEVDAPAYIAREALKSFLQADQLPGDEFIAGQVPPNVFFEHELNNGDFIDTPELWHQEIMH